MKNQKGFGLFATIAMLLVIVAIAGTGLYVYKRHVDQKLPPGYAPSDSGYHFSEVPVDTSKWVADEPLQDFSFKYPQDWRESGTPFKTQQAGQIVDGKPVYIQTMVTYLLSPGFTSKYPKYSEQEAYMPFTAGARIVITASTHSTAQPDMHSTYCASQVLNFDPKKGCESISGNGSIITLSTDNFDYDATVDFQDHDSLVAKNYYISVLHQIVKSFQLY